MADTRLALGPMPPAPPRYDRSNEQQFRGIVDSLRRSVEAYVSGTRDELEADLTGTGISDLSDVTITLVVDGEVLQFDNATSEWINQTLAEAGISAVGHTHAAADVVSGTFADARISESSVTQHQAALSITEAQISDLDHYSLADLLLEDGAGSGLDADLLDGQQGAFYQNAANITAGTLADARLSANVPLLDAANVFTAVQTFETRSHAGDGTGEARFDLLGAAGNTRGFFFGTGATLPGANRWFVFADARAEAGSDAGTNLNVFRYPDAGGSPLGMPLFIERATGNVALLNGTSMALPGFGSGTNIMFLGNRTAAPSSNPSGGGFLYAEAGALKYRGSGGTVTTIANA